MANTRQRLQVPVYYDFASTLCYVAHRVADRLAPDLEDLEIDLVWSPLDLASLLHIQPGAELLPARRANAARVAEELEVSVAVPRVWMDSRALLEVAMLLGGDPVAVTWRERVWSEVYEVRRPVEGADAAAQLGAELGLSWSAPELEAAGRALDTATLDASQALVTGVPTFMLGEWAFGGIQEPATMRAVLRRYAERARDGRMAR